MYGTPLVIGTCDTAGPIEVEATAGTPGPTLYASLNAAFTAINAGTHQGIINVEVCGNTTESASAILNSGAVAPASYSSVTVRPVGGSRIIEGTLSTSTVKLNGADNVTIDGRIGGVGSNRDLTIRNNSGAAGAAAVWLASVAAGNGASNNTIRNLEIAGGSDTSSSSNSTFGIIMCGTAITVSSNGTDNDNNSILANRVIKARYGITTRGTTTNLNISPIITDNIVGPASFGTDQIGKVGIFLQADTGAIVSRNTVQSVGCLEPQACTGADRMGIAVGNESWSMAPSTITSDNYTVTKNIVRDVIDENTFSSVGINLATTNGGAATNNLVANNFVYNVRSNGTTPDQAVGLGIAGGHSDRVVFNSISMTGDVDPGAATASDQAGSGIRIANASSASHANLSLRNNSVFMDLSSSSSPGVRFYAISGPSNAYSFGTGGENYNNYYINPSNTQLQTGGLGTTSGSTLTTQFASLALWQSAYMTAQDANSIQLNPNYISATDLHITGAPNESAGVAVAGVTDDIDGDARGATPDIGADEITLAGPGTVQFSATSYTSAEGNNLTITVNRTGGSSGAISVDYATGGGGATGGAACTAGVDYISASGTLNWADLDTAAKTFNVQLCVDSDVETESLNLTLSNPIGTSITGTNPVPLNITDNPPGTVQFSSTTYTSDEGLTAVITATRTGGTGGAVSVNYATSDGSATAGTCGSGGDYVAASGALNWANGDGASKTFNVTLCTDLLTLEGPETVNLTLSSPTGGATIGANNPALLTINDAGITFCSSDGPIVTGDTGTAPFPSTVYPSNVVVSGLVGTTNTVKVRLNTITHSFGNDLDILLVSPTGQKFILMSDVGDSAGLDSAVTLTFVDGGAIIPATGAIPTGNYAPRDITSGDVFATGAPAGPYVSPATVGAGTLNGTFGGLNPNGTWQLFVSDDFAGDTGSIASWCLEFTMNAPSPGTVQLNPAAYTPSEGVVQTVTVTRTSGTAGAVSVDYATGGGTATPGTCGTDDYVAASGTLNWADGDGAAKTFNVTTCSDAASDPGETIDITLSNATGGVTIGGTNPGTITITDIPPPLNGDYQVPGDYATLTAAVADYNLRGVSGPVRFLLNNATYDAGSGETFPLVISTTGPDTTATNTLTIQPNTGITSTIVGSSASGIVVIADQYVTINGDNVGGDVARNLTINNTATTANSYVVGLFNFGGTKVARNATVRYSNIRGGVTGVATVSWGIILNSAGGDYDNVLIEYNKIYQAYVGIGHYGVAATGINNDNIIRNNIIGDATGLNESIKLRGIEVSQSSGLTIDSNDIFGLPAGNSNSTQAGVLLAAGGSNNAVTRNNIHDFYYTGTGGLSTHGILISENGGTTNITNNFIHNIKADGDVFNTATSILWMPAGITISGTTTGTLNIDHNSIYMSGATLGSSFTGNSACFSSVAGVTGVNFRNNALRNSMTTVGAPAATNKTYAIATIGAGSLGTMFSSINYNTYFVNGTNPNIGTFGQTDRLNLVAFQAATTQDGSSQDVDPQFVSSIDLHLSNPSNTVVGGGTPLAGVTVDYDNDPRPGTSPDIGADEIVQAEGGVVPAGSFYNASFSDLNTLAGNVSVSNTLYLSGVASGGNFTTSLGCNATVSGASALNYVNGAVRKDYCATGVFDFPVGDGGYSPVNVNVTALGTNPSSLTVRPFDQFLAGFDQTESISRNWSIEETGDLTANLIFTYLDGDVNGNESDYRVWRREDNGTTTNMCNAGPGPSDCVDTGLNTLTVNGVSVFSRWTGSKPLAPSSSGASVSGRVTTASGQGIRGAAIVITGNSLPTPIIAKTGSLGYFQVNNLDSGQTYVVTVVSKRFTFSQPSRVINLTDSISDVDFLANPLE